MRSFRTSLLVSASASVAIALAQPTFAQDAQEEPAASSNAPADVIVVSANRREQNIQDAPAVITVFDDDIIDSMGVDDLGSISSLVPGLTLDGSHRDQNRLGMRGAFSAADTPSSRWISTGIPRPLSLTDTELSAWIFTLTASA